MIFLFFLLFYCFSLSKSYYIYTTSDLNSSSFTTRPSTVAFSGHWSSISSKSLIWSSSSSIKVAFFGFRPRLTFSADGIFYLSFSSGTYWEHFYWNFCCLSAILRTFRSRRLHLSSDSFLWGVDYTDFFAESESLMIPSPMFRIASFIFFAD